MKTMNLIGQRTAVIGAIIFFAIPCVAQAQLFKNADALMKEAMEADAPLLSPGNYAEAQRYYDKAKELDSSGRADKAGNELIKAETALNKAIEASALGKVTFSKTLKVRDLALAAEAAKYEDQLWQQAEKQFSDAARALEGGNVNSATDKSSKARGYYDQAELAAIKTAIVGKARKLIAAADEDKVIRQAPDTLNRAKALVAKAETDLDKNRYKTEEPISLAAEAEYSARHAAYLASQVRRVESKEISTENLILEWEEPLQEIAAALDVTTDMSEGFAQSAAASIAMAQSVTTANAEMTARVAELETTLGGTEQIAEESIRLQRQLSEVESLFSPREARVVREGNDLVLRLVGLSFQTGQSVIETQYFTLLTKVQKAIEIFPDSAIVSEGSTDSVGSDAVNMKLSKDRAVSVRKYLIANLGLPESRVSAVGFGKTRPIASNETEAGRAQNRRIDVVIKDARARDKGSLK